MRREKGGRDEEGGREGSRRIERDRERSREDLFDEVIRNKRLVRGKRSDRNLTRIKSNE